MLTELKIENVAVIEKARVCFGSGLNVLTGETGAGKSILIDSINAILGNRTSRDLVRSGAAKACIWATFEDISATAKEKLIAAGYEADQDLLLYREISAEGKGSCRINGMPATAAVVRDISQELITIHGQHDSQSLMNPSAHLPLLDAYAQNQPTYEAYHEAYRRLIRVKREMDALTLDENEKQKKLDTLRYQVDEIDSAQLSIGEEAGLQARQKVVSHAQSILEQVTLARDIINGLDDAQGAADELGSASNALDSAAQLDESLNDKKERLSEIYYMARDLGTELSELLEDYQIDPGELDMIETRLDEIYRLKKKYGATESEVLVFADAARSELEKIESSAEQLKALDAKMHELYHEARALADTLTKTRLDAFAAMNQQISEALAFLNMPGIQFVLQHSRGPLAGSGQDSIEFYISTNPGEAPKPLAKIASGGELSRIMLAIKSAMAEKDAIPTLIYDEIDTGVSGSAAGRIGELLHATAKTHQILCITHTAQIAAFASQHLLIQKKVSDGRTYTEIHPLDLDGRVQALAGMISGEHITDLSLANAREMIQNTQS